MYYLLHNLYAVLRCAITVRMTGIKILQSRRFSLYPIFRGFFAAPRVSLWAVKFGNSNYIGDLNSEHLNSEHVHYSNVRMYA